ncbi:hypothetical protein LCGC14_1340690 [marine sediment metagenome]|uniref:Uncharacterized protein n=1 Tax=marine sediment metagenome TaxID=412755 RepID=A0A0F9L073_9ZZZZ
MDKPEIEKYYKRLAKDMTDMLFDKNFLNPELTRKSIGKLEDYLSFLFQTTCQSAVTASELLVSLKDKTNGPK